jgi:multicopper oxidase
MWLPDKESQSHEVLDMHQHAQPGQPVPAESFPTDPTGLPEAAPPALLELADGDAFDLRIGPVAKRLDGTTVRMLGYNGSIPGPTVKVRQGSEVIVRVTNDGDLDTTVLFADVQFDDGGVIGGEDGEAWNGPAGGVPAGPWCAWWRFGGQSDVTSLTAMRALAWSTMALRPA